METPVKKPDTQPTDPAPADSGFTRSDTLIAARDGIHLFTVILTPRNAVAPLPILMDRTPYGAKNYASFLASSASRLGLEGYILVVQDIRGRFKSEGGFVMLRNPRDPKDPKAIDEGTDTHDTLEWLLGGYLSLRLTEAYGLWHAKAWARASRFWWSKFKIVSLPWATHRARSISSPSSMPTPPRIRHKVHCRPVFLSCSAKRV